ncbi:LytTR family DNA-binding domain-containing protein [Phenylobacterium sp.]|uniref:LytTR family DNA-binding domain-containing protein n=1 Tax=Phenylobacterium sp. TaxID=1871053 RepID=UPI00289EC303|nr:LytTR family DNA-binding domain-containing protein [Phenylobacterium sp.]
MTSKEASGTRALYWRAYALIGGAIVALNVVNMFTAFRDRPEAPWIMPAVEEATSAVSTLAFMWIAFVAFRIAPPGARPVWRMLGVQLAGLLAFAAAHVTGFMVLRMLAFRALDLPFQFDLAERFVYELRKDALGYTFGVAGLWALTRLYGPRPAEPAPAPATFDIRDGARVIRVPAADILAATSAGNYVEFALTDGRKPLMRSSLTAVEAQLTPLGFVRTHRSWLVNAARVTELRPEKSGDYAVRLGDIEAPLSRRFPGALARLRAG